MDLENKIAIVTGVSTGIGNSLVRLLSDKGVTTFGLGLNNPSFENKNFNFIQCDVSKYDNVCQSVKEIKEQTNNKIDIVINNSGLGYFGFIEDLPIEQLHQMFSVNVFGMFYILKETVGILKEQKSGHIINISSTGGLEGLAQVSGYCATKFAVKGLSESLFKEIRDFNVKVTCVYPGSTKTDFLPAPLA
jgi:short-subunit dehydrogenase